MKRCLIIFAKEPQKGKVKTRLQGYLSEEQCLNLYRAFLKDTIILAKDIQCEAKILAYDSNNKKPRYLKKIAPHFKFYQQKGENLGKKMHNAFKFAKENKADKTVIIGSDSPNLPGSLIVQAFSLLDKSDIVIGPSFDGGYYLIGLNRPAAELFKGIEWSSNKVLKQTIKRARGLKRRIAILDEWQDVDEPETLTHLRQDLKKQKDRKVARWTKKFFSEIYPHMTL